MIALVGSNVLFFTVMEIIWDCPRMTIMAQLIIILIYLFTIIRLNKSTGIKYAFAKVTCICFRLENILKKLKNNVYINIIKGSLEKSIHKTVI